MDRSEIIKPGIKIGFYTVVGKGMQRIKHGPNYTTSNPTWVVKCQCGNIREVLERHLRDGKSKSCGCRKRMTYAERYEAEFGHLNPNKRDLT